MIVINQNQVEELLPMDTCIKVIENVLKDLAAGEAIQHLRSVIPIEQENLMGLMPGYLRREEVIGAKVITIYPKNHKQGLPSHQGVVLLNDANDGSIKAIIDGTKITALRTAAVSAVATKVLSTKDSKILSLLGSGEQARTHLEAIAAVRPITKVHIWSRNVEKATVFKEEMERRISIPIQVFEEAEDAVCEADIICTLTAATEPILHREWVKEGAHINAVGACKATDRELDSDIVKRSLFYVDRVESAVNESGDYLIPLKEGKIGPNHIIGELGEVLTRKVPGRQSNSEITIFESLGLAIEDLAAANFIYQEAVKQKKGTVIPM
ncbi:ornithine cyclodeaminase family protein [Bacillus sp. FJAT-49736]|uniref:ornithine cyclodeaminase family protein n=1 Tax=Bacillus sp. FJAT-49736 TaxID=2833582 RepID=UPI001BCA0BFA|nr:ornithine cyclodeaminase family protein [Bacillus sp. FJAT-49736]MBS4175576.1 ornithine cyclodeaminase family protein [Bacillus sp. FJAT-49736]